MLLRVNVNGIIGSVEPMDEHEDDQAQQRLLYWRSRRGLLELELLLVPFVRECYACLPKEAQQSYAQLLEFEDLDIYDWLQGRAHPEDPSLASIIALIQENNNGRGRAGTVS
jgi:antitoxin CptB